MRNSSDKQNLKSKWSTLGKSTDHNPASGILSGTCQPDANSTQTPNGKPPPGIRILEFFDGLPPPRLSESQSKTRTCKNKHQFGTDWILVSGAGRPETSGINPVLTEDPKP